MGSTARSKPPALVEKPDIFRYHDYRSFFKDWITYLKGIDSGFSLRSLAKKAGLSASFLAMCTSGKRHLSLMTLAQLAPFLDLGKSELTYLEDLVRLGTSGSDELKVVTLEKMSKSSSYQKRNPNEAEFFTYMSHWYYIAIREMAELPEFKPDPAWIQARLKSHVPLAEVKAALEFLLQHGYLKLGRDGTVNPPKGSIDCQGAVYWPALIEYHRQMFTLATESIRATKSTDRNLDGYTVGLDSEQVALAKAILEEAMEKIVALERKPGTPAEQVYHLELALFPLTKKQGEK